MLKNVKLTNGLVNTEAVMMALAPRIGRGKAHDRLSEVSRAVLEGKGSLVDLLLQDNEICGVLDRDTLDRLLDPTQYLGAKVVKMTTRVEAVKAACVEVREELNQKAVKIAGREIEAHSDALTRLFIGIADET